MRNFVRPIFTSPQLCAPLSWFLLRHPSAALPFIQFSASGFLQFALCRRRLGKLVVPHPSLVPAAALLSSCPRPASALPLPLFFDASRCFRLAFPPVLSLLALRCLDDRTLPLSGPRLSALEIPIASLSFSKPP
eukprot:c14591_g1_i1 orf=78-479(-)